MAARRHAGSSSGPTSANLSMKLLVEVDRRGTPRRVVYAEAGKDVVDFLLTFLTLPIGTVVKLLRRNSMPMVGCVGNLTGGFVRAGVTYEVMDDLEIAPRSNVDFITNLNRYGIRDIGCLQRKTVRVGDTEGLQILRASLKSKTVLTDVFLRTNTPSPSPRALTAG
ncbi:hypothetical protein TRIUR3_12906 [Triticum urartu]|uniref:Uncharacterized protein n=2 Tax=Triticum TaxID=4564 RepID=A0A9R0RFB2_TRITD|nr:hypothetical protein TRIUR3_12906 [Triticum urartu]VAH58547.1 unnamed protein product [Triticum turgidum subsp. durum]